MTPTNECEALSERMPAVAAGRDAWSEAERAHLERCAGCRGEWALVSTAAGLGRGVEDALDPARIGAAVVARLAAERRAAATARRRIAGAGLAAAASIALALGLAQPRRGAVPARPAVATAGDRGSGSADPNGGAVAGAAADALVIPVPELETLDRGELESVLETMDAPLGAGGLADPGAMNDLNDRELERVLGSWEG
jgi:hypothetical protein